MTLDQLAIKYGSDKSSQGHNYCEFYEKHLPKNPKRILEIGVKEGASINMWHEYFPDATIHGLDLFEEYSIESVLGEHCERVVLHKGNQIDFRVLEILRQYDFDVIIDDGSHNSRDQMITFFGLFNGKHYFIEDLHCATEVFYRGGLPEDFTAPFVFNDMRIADDGSNMQAITFLDTDIMKPYKIVCIHAS